MAQKAEIKYNPVLLTPSALATHIDDIGFSATVLDDDDGHGASSIDVNVSILCVSDSA